MTLSEIITILIENPLIKTKYHENIQSYLTMKNNTSDDFLFYFKICNLYLINNEINMEDIKLFISNLYNNKSPSISDDFIIFNILLDDIVIFAFDLGRLTYHHNKIKEKNESKISYHMNKYIFYRAKLIKNIKLLYKSKILNKLLNYNGVTNKFNKEAKKAWEISCLGYPQMYNVYQHTGRIIAIGDIHGDLHTLKKCLLELKIIDNDDNWIGDDTYIVQCGDQTDDCRNNDCNENYPYSELELLLFTNELYWKAQEYGGMVFNLLGNHDIAAVLDDNIYKDYIRKKSLNVYKNHAFENEYNINDKTDNYLRRKILSTQYNHMFACGKLSFVIINDILFVHGGVLVDENQTLNGSNINISDINYAIRLFIKNINGKNNSNIKSYINNIDSLFLTRELGRTIDTNCDKFNKTLQFLSIGKMVIGHTPSKLSIDNDCDNKLIRIDTALSFSFDNLVSERDINVLEINGNVITPIIIKRN